MITKSYTNQPNRFVNGILDAVIDAGDSGSKEDSSRIADLLKGLIKRAKRQNVWKRFSNVSRGIMSLCVRLPLEFRAQALLRSLVKTIREAILLLSPKYRYWVSGSEVAVRMSEAACRWGNKEAGKWLYDFNYVLCVGLNRLSGFSVSRI